MKRFLMHAKEGRYEGSIWTDRMEEDSNVYEFYNDNAIIVIIYKTTGLEIREEIIIPKEIPCENSL